MIVALRVTEKAIYEQCYELLVRLNLVAWRLSQARAAKQTPGLPDLMAVMLWPRKLLLCIEIKKPGGRQRPEQKHFEQAIQALGPTSSVRYVLVHSAQELANRLTELRA